MCEQKKEKDVAIVEQPISLQDWEYRVESIFLGESHRQGGLLGNYYSYADALKVYTAEVQRDPDFCTMEKRQRVHYYERAVLRSQEFDTISKDMRDKIATKIDEDSK